MDGDTLPRVYWRFPIYKYAPPYISHPQEAQLVGNSPIWGRRNPVYGSLEPSIAPLTDRGIQGAKLVIGCEGAGRGDLAGQEVGRGPGKLPIAGRCIPHAHSRRAKSKGAAALRPSPLCELSKSVKNEAYSSKSPKLKASFENGLSVFMAAFFIP